MSNFCIYCGTAVNPEGNYCPKCGKPVDKEPILEKKSVEETNPTSMTGMPSASNSTPNTSNSKTKSTFIAISTLFLGIIIFCVSVFGGNEKNPSVDKSNISDNVHTTTSNMQQHSEDIDLVLNRKIFLFKDTEPEQYSCAIKDIDTIEPYIENWTFRQILNEENFKNIEWSTQELSSDLKLICFNGELVSPWPAKVSIVFGSAGKVPAIMELKIVTETDTSIIDGQSFIDSGMDNAAAMIAADASASSMLTLIATTEPTEDSSILKDGDVITVTGTVSYSNEPSDIGSQYCAINDIEPIAYYYTDMEGEQCDLTSTIIFTAEQETELMKAYVGQEVTVSGKLATECHGIPYITECEVIDHSEESADIPSVGDITNASSDSIAEFYQKVNGVWILQEGAYMDYLGEDTFFFRTFYDNNKMNTGICPGSYDGEGEISSVSLLGENRYEVTIYYPETLDYTSNTVIPEEWVTFEVWSDDGFSQSMVVIVPRVGGRCLCIWWTDFR